MRLSIWLRPRQIGTGGGVPLEADRRWPGLGQRLSGLEAVECGRLRSRRGGRVWVAGAAGRDSAGGGCEAMERRVGTSACWCSQWSAETLALAPSSNPSQLRDGAAETKAPRVDRSRDRRPSVGVTVEDHLDGGAEDVTTTTITTTSCMLHQGHVAAGINVSGSPADAGGSPDRSLD